jgi:hypothetical protein
LSPDVDLGKVLNDMDTKKGISLIPGSPTDFDPEQDFLPSDEEYNDQRHLVDQGGHSFWGKSSGFKLVQFALDTRNVVIGSKTPFEQDCPKRREEFWGTQEVSGIINLSDLSLRSIQWMRPLARSIRRMKCNFPEPELLLQLVDLYFECTNLFTPLLHRPTFERSVVENLHHHDAQFAMVLLLVCAIGVRFSDDTRIPRQFDAPTSPGWVWFHQAQKMRRPELMKLSLYDLQGYCVRLVDHDVLPSSSILFQLSAMFLEHTCPDTVRWNLVGIGIRLAQEVGAHRRVKYGKDPSVQSELWKRAFW